MSLPDFHDLDLSVARARVIVSLLAMLSLYVDPSTAGGLFHLTGYALITLLCHFAYSAGLYFALSRLETRNSGSLPAISTAFDLFFATAVAVLTEGQTSPSYVFFVFAIIAVGIRTTLRPTIIVTLASVTLYLMVIAFSEGMTNIYMMRAAYLAIAGYLIGFFGQQRAIFEARVRGLETRAERESIARSLHDGYIQALAGISLRLESCRDMLITNQPSEALAEIKAIQVGVAREYDEVRDYVRSLAGAERATGSTSRASPLNFEFRLRLSRAERWLNTSSRSCSKASETRSGTEERARPRSACTKQGPRFESRSTTTELASGMPRLRRGRSLRGSPNSAAI